MQNVLWRIRGKAFVDGLAEESSPEVSPPAVACETRRGLVQFKFQAMHAPPSPVFRTLLKDPSGYENPNLLA